MHGRSQTNQENSATACAVLSVEKSKWDILMTETGINFIGINTCGCLTHAVQNISLDGKTKCGCQEGHKWKITAPYNQLSFT